jgi:hypothetical protein
MLCRSCGTEIADKAIVCYRCGEGTSDPVRKAVAIRPHGGSPWPTLVGGGGPLLVAATLFVLSDNTAHPTEMTTGAEVSAAVGALVLLARAIRRR